MDMRWSDARSPGHRRRSDGMHASPWRDAALFGILVILVGACSSTTTSSAPSLASTAPVASASAAAVESAEASAPAASGDASSAPSPVITPLPNNASAAKPGDVVIRWYCCLGTGDAPEQVEVETKVADDFNAANPGIHLQFE